MPFEASSRNSEARPVVADQIASSWALSSLGTSGGGSHAHMCLGTVGPPGRMSSPATRDRIGVMPTRAVM